MPQHRVTCITLGPSSANHENDHQRITHIGGAGFYMTVAEAIVSMLAHSFYVQDQYGNVAWVHVVTPSRGPQYLRTVKDNVYTDNLRELPPCH